MAKGRKHGAISRARRVPASHLAPVLKKMKQKLIQAGVPKVALPKNDALLLKLNRNLTQWLDWSKIQAWIDEVGGPWRS